MFLFEKKVVYLSLFSDETKEGNVGFVRFVGKNSECRIDAQINKLEGFVEGGYPFYLLIADKKVLLAEVYVQAGKINTSIYFKADDENIYIKNTKYAQREISGIRIELGSKRHVSGGFGAYEKKISSRVAEKESEKDKSRDKNRNVGETIYVAEKMEESITFDSKWEQLLSIYPQVHPFGDERLFISMELKDFIVVSSSYQKLINNSFLLHGFYNYHHLILGPDKEIGGADSDCYYIGVPGTFFEREKVVAVMFGFEGFECSGPVEVGKFGYYLKKVEL